MANSVIGSVLWKFRADTKDFDKGSEKVHKGFETLNEDFEKSTKKQEEFAKKGSATEKVLKALGAGAALYTLRLAFLAKEQVSVNKELADSIVTYTKVGDNLKRASQTMDKGFTPALKQVNKEAAKTAKFIGAPLVGAFNKLRDSIGTKAAGKGFVGGTKATVGAAFSRLFKSFEFLEKAFIGVRLGILNIVPGMFALSKAAFLVAEGGKLAGAVLNKLGFEKTAKVVEVVTGALDRLIVGLSKVVNGLVAATVLASLAINKALRSISRDFDDFRSKLISLEVAVESFNQRIGEGGVPLNIDRMKEKVVELSTALGKSQEEILTATVLLAEEAPLIGLNAEQMEQLTIRTANLASITHEGLTPALQSVLSGILGNTLALQRWGITIREIDIQKFLDENERLQEQFGETNVQKLDQSSKAILRFKILMEETEAQGTALVKQQGIYSRQLEIQAAKVQNLNLSFQRGISRYTEATSAWERFKFALVDTIPPGLVEAIGVGLGGAMSLLGKAVDKLVFGMLEAYITFMGRVKKVTFAVGGAVRDLAMSLGFLQKLFGITTKEALSVEVQLVLTQRATKVLERRAVELGLALADSMSAAKVFSEELSKGKTEEEAMAEATKFLEERINLLGKQIEQRTFTVNKFIEAMEDAQEVANIEFDNDSLSKFQKQFLQFVETQEGFGENARRSIEKAIKAGLSFEDAVKSLDKVGTEVDGVTTQLLTAFRKLKGVKLAESLEPANEALEERLRLLRAENPLEEQNIIRKEKLAKAIKEINEADFEGLDIDKEAIIANLKLIDLEEDKINIIQTLIKAQKEKIAVIEGEADSLEKTLKLIEAQGRLTLLSARLLKKSEDEKLSILQQTQRAKQRILEQEIRDVLAHEQALLDAKEVGRETSRDQQEERLKGQKVNAESKVSVAIDEEDTKGLREARLELERINGALRLLAQDKNLDKLIADLREIESFADQGDGLEQRQANINKVLDAQKALAEADLDADKRQERLADIERRRVRANADFARDIALRDIDVQIAENNRKVDNDRATGEERLQVLKDNLELERQALAASIQDQQELKRQQDEFDKNAAVEVANFEKRIYEERADVQTQIQQGIIENSAEGSREAMQASFKIFTTFLRRELEEMARAGATATELLEHQTNRVQTFTREAQESSFRANNRIQASFADAFGLITTQAGEFGFDMKRTFEKTIGDAVVGLTQTLSQGLGNSLKGLITGAQTLEEVWSGVWKSIVGIVIDSVVQLAIQHLLASILGITSATAQSAAEMAGATSVNNALAFRNFLLVGTPPPLAATLAATVTAANVTTSLAFGGAAGGALAAVVKAAGLIGSVPAGAEGAIITRPTMALIAESGPELLTPLHGVGGASALPSQVGDFFGGGRGGGDVQLNVNLNATINNEMDIREVTYRIGKQLKKELRGIR